MEWDCVHGLIVVVENKHRGIIPFHHEGIVFEAEIDGGAVDDGEAVGPFPAEELVICAEIYRPCGAHPKQFDDGIREEDFFHAC